MEINANDRNQSNTVLCLLLSLQHAAAGHSRVSGFHPRTKHRGPEQTSGRLGGPRANLPELMANTLRIPQMPPHCPRVFIIIHPCVRACRVTSPCLCNRQLPVHLFCIAAFFFSFFFFLRLLQFSALAKRCSIRSTQKKWTTRSRVVGQALKGATFLRPNPGFFITAQIRGQLC